MARIAEIHERLLRWQEWFFTCQYIGVKSPAMQEKVDRSPRIGGTVVFDEAEALETDAAVAKLPDDLREVIKLVYLDPEGRTMSLNASILKMSRVSLYRKLELADKCLYERFHRSGSNKKVQDHNFRNVTDLY